MLTGAIQDLLNRLETHGQDAGGESQTYKLLVGNIFNKNVIKKEKSDIRLNNFTVKYL